VQHTGHMWPQAGHQLEFKSETMCKNGLVVFGGFGLFLLFRSVTQQWFAKAERMSCAFVSASHNLLRYLPTAY
jgi:hypothetical protein